MPCQAMPSPASPGRAPPCLVMLLHRLTHCCQWARRCCQPLPCLAMPSRATPCRALPRRATPCRVVIPHREAHSCEWATHWKPVLASPCLAKPCLATPGRASPSRAGWCFTHRKAVSRLPLRSSPCLALPCLAAPGRAKPCRALPRRVMLLFVEQAHHSSSPGAQNARGFHSFRSAYPFLESGLRSRLSDG